MRLIDADRLKRVLIAFFTGAHLELPHISKVIDFLDTAPTIDAEPVRHGHWEYGESFMLGSNRKCSVCGSMFPCNSAWVMSYCPDCGAKMDEEAEHE